MMWKLLNTPSRDLFNDYWNGGHYAAEGDSQTYQLADGLGSGMFGEEYSVAESQDMVIKVAKNGQSNKYEIDNLRSLESDNPHVPKFVSKGSLSVLIRSQTVEHQALMTIPKGICSTHQLCRIPGFEGKEVCVVAKQMFSALAYAHSKKLRHLDVRPSNIVLVSQPPSRYLLVDWGCLTKMCEEIDVFIGTNNYAHDFVHLVDRERKVLGNL